MIPFPTSFWIWSNSSLVSSDLSEMSNFYRMAIVASWGMESFFNGRRAAKRCTRLGFLLKQWILCKTWHNSCEHIGVCFVGRNVWALASHAKYCHRWSSVRIPLVIKVFSSSFCSSLSFPARLINSWMKVWNKVWRRDWWTSPACFCWFYCMEVSIIRGIKLPRPHWTNSKNDRSKFNAFIWSSWRKHSRATIWISSSVLPELVDLVSKESECLLERSRPFCVRPPNGGRSRSFEERLLGDPCTIDRPAAFPGRSTFRGCVSVRMLLSVKRAEATLHKTLSKVASWSHGFSCNAYIYGLGNMRSTPIGLAHSGQGRRWIGVPGRRRNRFVAVHKGGHSIE